MEKKGFTIIEIITVVIILAILATLAIPPFIKTMESAKGRLAKTNLKLILAAEKVYRNEIGRFMPYRPGTVGTADINTWLNLDLKDGDFRFEVETTDPQNRFRAKAIRQKGRYAGREITIDQDGNITPPTYP